MWIIIHWNMFITVKSQKQKQAQCQWMTNRMKVLLHQCIIIPYGCLKRKISAYMYWYKMVSKNMFSFVKEKKKNHRDTGGMGVSLVTKAIKNSRSLGMSW